MLTAILELLKNLPAILKLIQQLKKNQEDAAVSRKIKEDIEKINKAFEEKDEQALRDIFNS